MLRTLDHTLIIRKCVRINTILSSSALYNYYDEGVVWGGSHNLLKKSKWQRLYISLIILTNNNIAGEYYDL